MSIPLSKIETFSNLDRSVYLGDTLLGPVIHRYLLGLHTYLHYLPRNGGTKILFCARAGVRIKRLYESCAEASGWPKPADADMFWISRLLACKGVYARTPEPATTYIASEFVPGTLKEVVKAVLRNVPETSAAIDWNDGALVAPSERFGAWLKERSANAVLVSDYLEGCSSAFDRYIKKLTRGVQEVVLVDTGWQGSTQSLLARAHPELDWSGLYFGRMLQGRQVASDVDRMIGVMFERDFYDPAMPESAFTLHRHLIETIFEPNGPSIEEVCDDNPGSVATRQIADNLGEVISSKSDPIYEGVRHYLKRTAGQVSVSVILARHEKAMTELARILAYPTRDEAMALYCKPRTADFGRATVVDVLLGQPNGAEDVTTPDERIAESLWPQGQIALEYNGKAALEKQEATAKSNAVIDYFDPMAAKRSGDGDAPDVLPEDAAPTVAVITRTKNRPILLKRARRSVENQTYKNIQWVIVNDGGDESEVREVIAQSSLDPQRIHLVSNEHSVGMEAASNLGIRAIGSDYVVIHDDDDSWDPQFLERSVSYLESPAGQRYGGAITKTVYVSEEIRGDDVIEHGRVPYQDWVRNVQLAEVACGNIFAPIAFVYRRKIYDDIGGYNENLPVLGDWHFNIAFLMKADIGVVHEPLAYYHHRDRGNAGTYSNSVVGGVSKHEEFNAIVRNQFIREMGVNSPASLMIGLGYVNQELRNQMAQLRKSLHDGLDRAAISPGATQDKSVISLDQADLDWTIAALHTQFKGWRRLLAVAQGVDLASVRTWAQVCDHLKRLDTPLKPPPSFDENQYMTEYPDVAQSVSNGQFSCAFEHYVRHGRNEGRRRATR